MSNRFFTKINNKGRLVIIDKECHTELFDMTLACEVLNRLDLKLKYYNEVNGEQQATIDQLNLAIDDLLSHTSCDEIKKENEQLKKENKELKDQCQTKTKQSKK